MALRDAAGNWTRIDDNQLITNSGYGPADVPMVGETGWVTNSTNSSRPAGLYRTEDGGLIWTQVSTALLQYMDFASENKGFALAGGPAYISYDGGFNWFYQAAGGGLCCHLNNIWAFDTNRAIWHEGGAGDPNGKEQIFTYDEPWEANFEILPATPIKDGFVKAGDPGVPMASYQLFNHGPVPIRVKTLLLRASGSGDDSLHVSQVKLWHDRNANGYVDQEDDLLGQGAYSADNGTLALSVGSDLVLQQFLPIHLLVTYDFSPSLPVRKTFSFNLTVQDIDAETTDTGTPLPPNAPANCTLRSRSITSAQEIFADDFESGLIRWAADTDDPVPDPGYGWQITAGAFVSPTHSAFLREDSSHEGFAASDWLTLIQPLDLSSEGNYYLTFYHRYQLPPNIRLWVEASTDDGQTWEEIGKYQTSALYSTGDFVFEAIDLSEHSETPSLWLRFRYDNTWVIPGSTEWYLDNIRIFYNEVPAAVRVLSPNGGEFIPAGSTYPIEWEAPPDVVKFKLLYSIDNGLTWTLIKKGVTGTNYDWDVPQISGNKKSCRVKVVGYDDSGKKLGADISDSPFMIEVVTLSNPNGAEILKAGSLEAIRRRAASAASTFDLLLSLDNKATWSLLDDLTTPGIDGKGVSGRSFDWTIPSPATGNKWTCFLKIIAYDGSGARIGTDTSDGPFTIEVVRLISPNGGESWKSGEPYSVKWETNATIREVKTVQLFYTTNGGATWKQMEGSPISSNTGSFYWTVPPVTKDRPNCKVKVVLKDADGKSIGSDLSDAIFKIQH